MIRDQADHLNSTDQECQNGISVDLFLHFSLIPAVFITGVLSFLQKRAKILGIDHKLPFLKRRFAIVVPLDTIGSISNRWSYGFAFGAVSSSVLLLFSENYKLFDVPPWATAILYLIRCSGGGPGLFPFLCLPVHTFQNNWGSTGDTLLSVLDHCYSVGCSHLSQW
ncbi:Stimulated by retinoic acid gene 6 protein-like [Larimichthys crocea]|uniref:Uncharacterized protein n=1 Tax=Larimichthys crocea TaxID=215358 RepID=A0ACD3RWQ2_LARCR|nr:Stimulated by retinoic acid gene 6 protein-like [Larimichthys crocea]